MTPRSMCGWSRRACRRRRRNMKSTGSARTPWGRCCGDRRREWQSRHGGSPNRPAKLTGIVDHWPALARWSLDHFARVAGDAVVEAQVERERDPDYELAKDNHRRLVRFGELIDWLRKDAASNDIYLTAYNSGTNAAALAILWDDIAPIALLDDRRPRDGFFWLGPRGTLTPRHHDLTNNLLVQVMGRKRVRLAPPWALARMKNGRHCFSDWGNDALPAGGGGEVWA